MDKIVNLLAAAITWIGCLAPYLSSDHQQLLPNRLPKALGWMAFGGSACIATGLLSLRYHPIAAALLTLTFMMSFWCCLILAGSHTKDRPMLLNAVALGLIVMIAGVI